MPDPEALARLEIDCQIEAAGWVVQDRDRLNPFAGTGIAVREVSIPGAGETDYLLVAGRKAIGIVEAKPEGTTLTGVETQTRVYAEGMLPGIPAWTSPLPMLYESTGMDTRFTNLLEPKPRSRLVFTFHRPETLLEWVKQAPTAASSNARIVAVLDRRASIIENLDATIETNLKRAEALRQSIPRKAFSRKLHYKT